MQDPSVYLKDLNVRVQPWTFLETLQHIERRIDEGIYTTHTQLNVAKWVATQRDSDFGELVSRFSIVNVDGKGLIWGANILGNKVPERVAGIDLFTALVKKAAQKKWRVFLLGGTQEIVERASQKFKADCADLIIQHHHGYFWTREQALVEEVQAFKPDLVFVGITSPKQEEFIEEWGPHLGATFIMGVGGSFDVVSGSKARAPEWVQKVGFEWFYRMVQEPRRLAGRYLSTNLVFGWHVISAHLRRKLRLQ